MTRFQQFFSTNFLEPHGFCFLWLPELVWVHVLADALIAVSYFSIPLALWVFIKKRPDMPFRSIFLLFATFITLCGLTHIADIIVFWIPAYGYQGILLALTALVSASTAFVVWSILPLAVKLPSPAQYQAMNEELKIAYDEVEHKVIERTQALTHLNAALEVERRKLAQANEAKKQFIANVSHEIRTPLNAIVVLSEKFYKHKMPADKHEEALESLYNSSIMLRQLIHDILDFSKIEANTMELAADAFSLHHMIKEVQPIAEVQAAEKHIYFKVDDATSDLPRIKGDAVRLKQILLNLIANAIKFTIEGGVTLTARGDQAAEHVAIHVSIKDTGIGISDEHQQKIFEHFMQATEQTTQKFGGTGLGLAISKQLTEKMGGSLTVQSKPGYGSEFVVQLTLPIASQQAATAKVAPVEKQVHISGKILVVEDHPGNILVARLLLEEMGYPFDIAMNGAEAVDRFATGRYDLVLMDLRLPDMTGYDITAAIRSIEAKAPEQHKIPIIAMTAYATREEREKCFEAGMNDFTTKPIDIDELRKMLEKWLGKH